MDLSIPGSTNSTLSTSNTPVFGDNVQDLLNAGALNVNPSAIITVNSLADALDDLNSGVTTLRDAINQANGDTGEDLIVFDRSLFSNAQTIGLNLGELDITHNLDIIVPRDSLTGADLVTVSGNNASRVLEIETGATVTLSGLIVESGSVLGDNGGGIKNSGTLTLDSSIVRNNSTTGGELYNSIGGDGGGIYNSGILTVSNSTISSNSAKISNAFRGGGGGGICNNKTLDVSDSTISGNFADIDGGGIGSDYLYNGFSDVSITVSNSTISGNSAKGGGGGIAASYSFDKLSKTTVNNSIISGNSAMDGGGIFDASSGSVVNNSTITGNSAIEGGGIFNTSYMGGGVVSNSIISGNSANSGGGIYIYNTENGENVVSNCIIVGNSAMQGGGIYNNQDSNSTVSNIIINGESVISNSIISGNSASSEGGGIFNTGATSDIYNETLNLSNSTISGNSAGSNGGGIFNLGGIINVSNSALVGNTALNDGGGVYNIVNRFPSGKDNLGFTTAQSVVNVSNSTLIGNTAQNDGGAAYNNSILILAFSTLTLNQATNSGGVFNAIFVFNNTSGSTSVRNTIIAANLLSTDGQDPDVSGTFTSNGYNLIGDSTGSTGFSSLGDLVGTSDNAIDPRLAPLDFNGGSTQTIALLPDSPAIDAGDPTVLDTDPTTDQRGLPRRASDGRTDIGAFEFSS